MHVTMSHASSITQDTLNTHINMQEMCNGVTNPITGETMTNYKKVIACPQLHETWLKAMYKGVVRTSRHIHKQKTRSNTPMSTMIEELTVNPTPTLADFDDNWYKTPQKSERKTKPH